MMQLKKPTTYQEQLDILKSRGIIIDDPNQCIAVLETVNYYRFTAYFLPFKRSDGQYCENTQFSRVYRIYEFDRKLRSVLFAALEEVEIYLRAKLSYFYAHKYGAEGYMNDANFSSKHQAENSKKIWNARFPATNALRLSLITMKNMMVIFHCGLPSSYSRLVCCHGFTAT